jgi:hypothetical protein
MPAINFRHEMLRLQLQNIAKSTNSKPCKVVQVGGESVPKGQTLYQIARASGRYVLPKPSTLMVVEAYIWGAIWALRLKGRVKK